ncbi:MAG TPA: DUF58 domain-containing protein [Candidatus Limnocylindrales bacterium]|nr:DUF58 domain-containing protein [Candidatus Limnocylindrales bacterium]
MIGAGAGFVLIVIGGLLSQPALIAVGTIAELVWLLRSVWTRYGLRNLTYERHLESPRATVGEEIGLDLVVRNRKLLPVPWLAIEDRVSRGTRILGRVLATTATPGVFVLRTTWTLGWYQRVTRHLRIAAEHRGVYDFRGASLLVADLFARDMRVEELEQPLAYRVVPRSVPVRGAMPVADVPGPARAPRGLFEEPTLYAGVRPYWPGDSLRRVHWKATARLRRPVSRRYDPGLEREVVIAIDAQTTPGPFWLMRFDEDLIEGLCTAGLSLARSLIESGAACGLAANAWSRRPGRTVYLPPSAAPDQVSRVADALAELSRWASLPFANLLDDVGRRSPAASLLALTSLPTDEVLQVLRQLQASGRRVRLCALGEGARHGTAVARGVGLAVSTVRLAPDWRSSDALELVG